MPWKGSLPFNTVSLQMDEKDEATSARPSLSRSSGGRSTAPLLSSGRCVSKECRVFDWQWDGAGDDKPWGQILVRKSLRAARLSAAGVSTPQDSRGDRCDRHGALALRLLLSSRLQLGRRGPGGWGWHK